MTFRLAVTRAGSITVLALAWAAIPACGGSAFDDTAGDGGAGSSGTGGSAGASGASGSSGASGTSGSGGASGSGPEDCGGVSCGAGNQCCHGRCRTLDLPCEPEPCGPVICGPAEYCCNASCGMCAPPGGGCPAIACEDAGPGPVPEPCGPVECAPGSVCCDAMCGICAPKGAGCPLILCQPECAPMDATGEGPCAAFFGYAWNGNECVGLRGCNCVGKDCPSLFDSPEACDKAHEMCPRFF